MYMDQRTNESPTNGQKKNPLYKQQTQQQVIMLQASSAITLMVPFLSVFFQWMKLDDLFEKERNIRLAMAERAGVLSLMLHQTIDHDPMKQIVVPQRRESLDDLPVYT